MKIKILVDSDEFWKYLKKDIISAKNNIYIQTFSFEGDSAGKKLCHQLLSSKAGDIKILVDNYTKYVINDKFLYTIKNLLDKDLRREVKDTFQMIDEIVEAGINVKFMNPVGPLLIKFPERNHKKLVVVDDRIAYIGGINFCDHNFYWHDMMLRIESKEAVRLLKDDFLFTWEEKKNKALHTFKNIQFYLLSGKSNHTYFKPVFDLIDNAEKSIIIESPYITFPFYEKLRLARKRGVDVTIISPENNNKNIFKQYTLWEASRSDIDLRLYQGRMVHLKAMVIDKSVLIAGSSNFDYLSYMLHEEILVVITEQKIVTDFLKRVIEKDISNSVKFNGKVNNISGYARYFFMKVAGWFVVLLSKI